jgi:hypothetical protein
MYVHIAGVFGLFIATLGRAYGNAATSSPLNLGTTGRPRGIAGRSAL